MRNESPKCWASDPNTHGVRINLSAEYSLLLPFDQFAFSELTSHSKEQRLRLIFATHEVLVCGTCLRRIEAVLQTEELAMLTLTPKDQKHLVNDGQSVILQIIVSEASHEGMAALTD